MANTFFQISCLCIFSLFVGFGLGAHEHIVVLKYNGKFYMAKGSLTGGQWKVDENGQLIPTNGEMSLVVLSVCQPFVVSENNEMSIDFDGKFTGKKLIVPKTVYSDNYNVSIIPFPEGNVTAPSEKSFSELETNAHKIAGKKWVTFPLSQIHTQNLEKDKVNIVCGITIGTGGEFSPDITLVSDDETIELLGYRINSAVRFVGNYAVEFSRASQSVKLWYEKSDKSDSSDKNPMQLTLILAEMIGDQLIVDVKWAN